MRPASRVVAVSVAGLGLAFALVEALGSCRRAPSPSPSARVDASASPQPIEAGATSDAASSASAASPRRAPGGLLLDADHMAQCVVERNVLRHWGTNITTHAYEEPLTVTFPEDVVSV